MTRTNVHYHTTSTYEMHKSKRSIKDLKKEVRSQDNEIKDLKKEVKKLRLEMHDLQCDMAIMERIHFKEQTKSTNQEMNDTKKNEQKKQDDISIIPVLLMFVFIIGLIW